MTVAASLAAATAFAEPVTVAHDAIRDTVTGKTVDLDTPLGQPITIVYRDNGTMSGSAGTALSIYLGAATDRGRWWVADGRLCQKFFKWLEGETSCLRLRQDGRRISWVRDDGKQGTATITATVPPKQKPTYALGGPDLAKPGQHAGAPQPAPRHAEATAEHTAAPPSSTPAHTATPVAGWHTTDRTPAYDAETDRPMLAALTPAAPRSPGGAATIDHARPHSAPGPHPATPAPRPAPERSFGLRLPEDWPDDHSIEAQKPHAAAMIGSMIQHTQFEHARHRWCHEVHDYRLLTRPHAVDAEAPELLTAWRHMAMPEHSNVPAASCIVPAPALVEVSRQIEHLR